MPPNVNSATVVSKEKKEEERKKKKKRETYVTLVQQKIKEQNMKNMYIPASKSVGN